MTKHKYIIDLTNRIIDEFRLYKLEDLDVAADVRVKYLAQRMYNWLNHQFTDEEIGRIAGSMIAILAPKREQLFDVVDYITEQGDLIRNTTFAYLALVVDSRLHGTNHPILPQYQRQPA